MWRSTDGGDTWQRITNGMPTGDMGRIGLDISASNPDVMYAVIEAFQPGAASIARTIAARRGCGKARSNQRPNYFSQIRIDTKNPDRVWLLATALYRVERRRQNVSTSDSVARRAHPDHHAMWIDPRRPEPHHARQRRRRVLHVRRREDLGTTSTTCRSGQFYDIAIDDREPYWIYGGAQDNGSWAFPSATYSRGGMTNTDVMNTGFGDGFQSAVDPTGSDASSTRTRRTAARFSPIS